MRRCLLLALLLLGALPLAPARARADGPFPRGMSAPPNRANQDIPAPLDPDTDREATVRFLVAEWRAAAGLGEAAVHAPASQAGSRTGLDAGASGLVGGNFPIANFPDVVSGQEWLANPELAHNPSRDEYLAVWQAEVRATGYNIYARRMTAVGAFWSPAFAVCEASGDQIAPRVAYDSSLDQYWVVWTDLASGQFQVRARRVSATGTLLGAEIAVTAADAPQLAASVACGSGKAVIVWASQSSASVTNILARGFNSDGSPCGSLLLLSPALGVAFDPDICYNSEDHHFLAVWAESHAGTGWDIRGWALTYDPVTCVVGSAFGPLAICYAAANQRIPRPAYNPQSDRYLIVWQDGRNLATRGTDIYGQLMARNGVLVGGAIAVNSGAYMDHSPAVATRANGGEFMVVFAHDVNGADQFQIYACSVSAGGAASTAAAVRDWLSLRGAPAIASRFGTSDMMVIWEDNGLLTQPDIQAQRVNISLALQGPLITVCAGRKGQEAPSVAYNHESDEYFVVWQDFRSWSDYDIYGRRISRDGALLGTDLLVSLAGYLNGSPHVAFNPVSHEYLVAWQEVHALATGYDIYAQRVSSVGQLQGGAILVSRDTATPNEGLPRVACNELTGEYLVVWHSFTLYPPNAWSWNILGQRLSTSGALIGGSYFVCSHNANQHAPQLAHNSLSNEYVVIWQDFRNPGTSDIYGQRLNAAGALIGTWYAISIAPCMKGLCGIAFNDQDNQYLAVWGDNRSGSYIYGVRLDSTGWVLGSDFAVSAEAAPEMAPALAFDQLRHEYVSVWWEFYDATDWDIYGGQVSAGGSPLGRFAVSTAPEVQNQPQLAQNTANGEFLIVWQDFRNGSYDVYGQRWSGGEVEPPTPTLIPTETSIPTPTHTPTPTSTGTLAPTRTPTATPTSTPTLTPTRTATATTAPSPTPCIDIYEPDDTPAQAQWVAVNDPLQWHNSEPAGDVDYIYFNAKAGWSYTLRTFDLTGAGNDTLLRLYGLDGRKIAENDDDPPGSFASRVDWTCPATGEYRASVQQAFSNVHGCAVGYGLEVTGGLETPTPRPTVRTRLYMPVIVR